jgi:two-component system phosphate regulon sensor histidine kinase PhoR
LFKSIRWRLTTIYLFIIAISFSTIGGYFIWRIEDFYLENLQRHVLNNAFILAELFSTLRNSGEASSGLIDEVCKKMGASMESRITFISEDGSVLGDSYQDVHLMENHLQRPEVQAALAQGKGISRRYSTTTDMHMFYMAIVVEESSTRDIIRLAVPLSYIQKNISQLRLILISGLLAALLISALLSLRFSGGLIKPLKEIGAVASSISSGDFDRKVVYQSEDELGNLAKTINEMGRTLKEKVRQISQEKSKLETVISAMTSGVILCNARGSIDFINDAALKIFAVEREDVVSLSLQAALRNVVLFENLQEVLEKGEMKSFELNLFFPDTRVLQVYMVPVIGETGKEIMGALAVFHDITGIRSLESMRSEFVANVSHELRTPLTIIKGYAETLLGENNQQDAETVKKILTIIDKEAERLARLLKDLLNLSRIESRKGVMKKQEVNIKQVVAEARGLLQAQAREKALNLNLRLPEEELKSIKGDSDWLLQLFIDVIDNAIKYTPQGGSIDIKIEQRSKEVLVSVSDTGIGIPTKNLPYIFERFYRVDKGRSRRLGGTGLGLAIVKHIVDAHNGRVEVKSTVGVGTTFYIYLPSTRKLQ